MRYGSELLTDPQALKAMTEVLDTKTVTASNMTTLLNWAAGSGQCLRIQEEASTIRQNHER